MSHWQDTLEPLWDGGPRFFCVLGNRDFLKMETPSGPEKRPIWEFVEGQREWLTSLAYLDGVQRPPGSFILDCGAWSYKSEPTPRWSPEECVEQYAAFARPGDLVASPDHLVLKGASPEEEAYRIQLTLDNAREFLRFCPAEWRPLAVIHGSTIGTRVQVAQDLLGMGYRHLAIGSVAIRARDRRFITSVLDAVTELREEQPFYLHILGVSALSWYPVFRDYGVDSYDGSSAFFAAFTAGQFFWHQGDGTLAKVPVKETPLALIPRCVCLVCRALRAQGVDTRRYGSNERNMGRAVHNINQYLRALRVARESLS